LPYLNFNGQCAILRRKLSDCAVFTYPSSLFLIAVPRLSPLLTLIAVAMCAHVALGAARVTTTLYALSLHASEFTVGTLIALFAVFPMLLAVSMGRIIDRTGVQQPLRAGAVIASVGVIVAASFKAVAALYVAAILIGTGFMAIFIATQHAVGLLLANEQKAAGYSKLSVGFSVSSFIGPLVAGFTIDHAGHVIAYIACGVFTLLSFVVACSGVLRKLPTHTPTQTRATGSALQLLRNRELRGVYFVGITLAAAWDMFTFVTPIRGTQLGFSASTIGMILASFSAATFVVRIAMPGIVRRYHEWQILTGALAAAGSAVGSAAAPAGAGAGWPTSSGAALMKRSGVTCAGTRRWRRRCQSAALQRCRPRWWASARL
jgi:MFS family permease